MATIADGRTIPFDWYSDPAVLRLEQERIFRRAWQYAGRADQVAEPGDWFTCFAGTIPIVVTRDKSGNVNAFVRSRPANGKGSAARRSLTRMKYRCSSESVVPKIS